MAAHGAVPGNNQPVGGVPPGGLATPSKPKLDPRLAFLLSLQLMDLAEAIQRDKQKTQQDANPPGGVPAGPGRTFSPLTYGVFLDHAAPGANPDDVDAPFISCFILSGASGAHLNSLGARIRNRAGDVFTASVPIKHIPALVQSPAVRYIELARPLFPTLDIARARTDIDTLHNGMPPNKGAGAIVGIIDGKIDFHHDDFRKNDGTSRILFIWDQMLTPQGGEAGPPVHPALPDFEPEGGVAGSTYGVEYDKVAIDGQLSAFAEGAPAYGQVRHSPAGDAGVVGSHCTMVAGIAAGGGRGDPNFRGAAPEAELIVVGVRGTGTTAMADSVQVTDAFHYIFARAADLGMPCVINMSLSDNQGPHDGTRLGEQSLDNLLLTPGRMITLPAGNTNTTGEHATGQVTAATPATPTLVVAAGAERDEAIEFWYDGHDRFDLTVHIPGLAAPVGPVSPGSTLTVALPGGAGGSLTISSISGDPRNGDNVISVIVQAPPAGSLPVGNWVFTLTGTVVINGHFNAWVDRNNRPFVSWQTPQADSFTVSTPGTARRPLTVGSHDTTFGTPIIAGSSGRGPTRDDRTKPEISTVGFYANAPFARNMATNPTGPRYGSGSGTSFAAPLAAGACALLFDCRGRTSTWADLKFVLEQTAKSSGVINLGVPLAMPNDAFGFGSMMLTNACTRAPADVDVWVRDAVGDNGDEPFTGQTFWKCPDIEIFDTAGNPIPNPIHDAAQPFTTIVRVTVRNRGTSPARVTSVHLFWADPATSLPFPAEWHADGIFTGAPTFANQGNTISIAQIDPGSSVTVEFAWAPPAVGANIRADDHFCLLALLENESDPSDISIGGWSIITESNNVGLRNVHVAELSALGAEVPDDDSDSKRESDQDARWMFHVIGSGDDDSLEIRPNLMGGEITVMLPAQAVPLRDARALGDPEARPPFGAEPVLDPVSRITRVIPSGEVESLTEIRGAPEVSFEGGTVEIKLNGLRPVIIPRLRIEPGIRLPVRVRVSRPSFNRTRCSIDIGQLSGGRRVGGVTLEVRVRRPKAAPGP